MSSTWGEKVKISIFGGSHTEAVGVTIDGLPEGEEINLERVQLQMARRAPGRDKAATARLEEDVPEILSGFLEGKTTGAPLCAIIRNKNQHSGDYSDLKILPRPGHADYTAGIKYADCNDIRGGGHFSGRLTAPMVFAGAVCRQILEGRGITIGAHAASIANIRDGSLDPVRVNENVLNLLNNQYFPVISAESKAEMYHAIESARLKGDSVGGIIECAVTGVRAGLGSPMFGGVENAFSNILFGIPAVKAVEFGAGFASSYMYGSKNNDSFYFDESGTVRTKTNNSGGILGGITNGMPIIFRVGIKPTPSISAEQETVNLETGKNDRLIIKGRHDPCIVPRAIPVVEAAAAIALMNLM